ncbi:MAG: pesticidal protein Cry7Aa [Bacteroidota bacterium]|nr:pesticidal protein Cry7Aa [Bacteroidota bacterium]
MIKIKKEGILLQKTHHEFENEGVLNPAVIRQGDSVHLLYRAVRKGNHSTIGYCRLDGPLTIAERWNKPFMAPEFDYESQGVEDARIVQLEEEYYLTYTGYDGTNARGALATGSDFMHLEKQGLIVPPVSYAEFVALAESGGRVHSDYYHNHKFYYQENDPERKIMLWDKDVIFFPRRIHGKLVFIHRIRPGIQIVSIDHLEELTSEFWKDYFMTLHDHIVLDPVYPHESSYIGGGCPPIETEHGWLLIYHGVQEAEHGLVYSACTALLDLNDPSKELARLPYALFAPEYVWEKDGEVNNVVFPTGTAVFGTTLFIYYGAADTRIACASVSLPELMSELLNHTSKE